MEEYNIIPEFCYYKAFPFFAIICQLVAVGLMLFGIFVTSVGFILAFCFQFCALYYTGLFICNKYYRVNISSAFITIWSVFNKVKKYPIIKLRWKIVRIPWYNSHYLLLYSSGRMPIAVIRPHWKNALRILSFPHSGTLGCAELEYLNFLKKSGLLKQNGNRFYALR